MIAIFSVLSLVVAGSGVGHAASSEHDVVSEVEAAHHHHEGGRNLFGVKITGLTAFERLTGEEMTEHLAFGAGPFYERAVIPGMLDVELAVLFCRGHGATVIPVELLFKKPFHPTDHLTLYLGVGPTLDIVVQDGERHAFPALMAGGGAYLWVNSHIGLDLEASIGHLFERQGLQELVVATGPVVHF